jgi:hypothetical protein
VSNVEAEMVDLETAREAWLAVREYLHGIIRFAAHRKAAVETAKAVLEVMDAELPEWAPAKPEEATQ